MLIGASTNDNVTAADQEVLRVMRATCAKLHWHHDYSDVTALRYVNPAIEIMVRLPDSRHPTGRFPGVGEYAAECAQVINYFYPQHIHVFQLDNEPNGESMWDTHTHGPAQYQWFVKQVLPRIRALVPADVALVSPPLSFSPRYWQKGGENPTPYTLDEWFAAYSWTDGGRVPSLWSLFNYVGANCYYQSPRQVYDPSYGAGFDTVYGKAGGGKQVVVCEWNSSLCDRFGKPPYTDAQLREIQRSMDAWAHDWVEMARQSGRVVRADGFILPGATGDWIGFKMTANTAAKIGDMRCK